MTCDECLENLHDYLDRELTPDSLKTIQDHLDKCAPCLERFDFSARLKTFVQKKAAHEDVPAGLLDRIKSEVAAAVPKSPKVRALPMNRGQSLMGLAASVAVALTLTTGLVFQKGAPQPDVQAQARLTPETRVAATVKSEDSPVLSELVADHKNCTQSVSDGDELTVQQAENQLSDGLGYGVKLPAVASDLKPVAVRMCNIRGVQVGHLILRHQGHLFSWFVLRTSQFPSVQPCDEPHQVADTNCMMRAHGDQTVCIVSQQPQEEVRQVALETGF